MHLNYISAFIVTLFFKWAIDLVFLHKIRSQPNKTKSIPEDTKDTIPNDSSIIRSQDKTTEEISFPIELVIGIGIGFAIGLAFVFITRRNSDT